MGCIWRRGGTGHAEQAPIVTFARLFHAAIHVHPGHTVCKNDDCTSQADLFTLEVATHQAVTQPNLYASTIFTIFATFYKASLPASQTCVHAAHTPQADWAAPPLDCIP